jgi:FkbM family methyltransferase
MLPWLRRGQRNILFIGASNMNEIDKYALMYRNGIFIEAIPNVFKQLQNNLQNTNRAYNTNFRALNHLVTDIPDKEYIFNIFDNNGMSSSIYEPNSSVWKWPHAKKINTITLKSTTIETILNEQKWGNIQYDVILDVQGAELDVLKGFGEKNFKNIQRLTVEVSTVEFYKNGVLFDDLNAFIISHGLKLTAPPTADHCDVVYVR